MRIDLEEFVVDEFLVVRAYADSRVEHDALETIGCDQTRADRHRTFVGELHAVVE